jgi:hypothetical protein
MEITSPSAARRAGAAGGQDLEAPELRRRLQGCWLRVDKGGRPAPLASRYRRISTHLLLSLHAI